MREINRLVINGRGDEIVVPSSSEQVLYQDKKQNIVDEEHILEHIASGVRLYREMEVGQKEASIELHPQYPDLPVNIWLNCDDHMGSNLVDYKAFLRDYKIVRDTPNFFVLNNGDLVDNFMVSLGKTAVGVYESSITPQQQALLIQSLFNKLDDQGKILAYSMGNHDQWLRGAGYKFENTWLRSAKCPILNCGGLLKVSYGATEYKIAVTHQHWGRSSLNPTNAAKRYMEHEWPSADVIFLGHSHQAESLFFRRDKEVEYRYAIIGGTYKVEDEFVAENGGDSPQLGGFVLRLSPQKRAIEVLRSVTQAKKVFDMELQIKEQKRA